MNKEKIVNSLDKIIENLLYLMIFFIPISKAAIEIIFGLAMLLFFFKKILKPDLSFFKNFTYILLILFFAFCALSLFNSGVFLAKSMKALLGKWLKYILIFILVANTFNDAKRLRKAVRVFIITAALIALDTLFQACIGNDFLRGRPLVYGVVTASFENQNALAGFLTPLLLLTIAFFLGVPKEKKYKIYIAILAIALAACLILTTSRGGWLGFILGLLLMTFLLHKFKVFIPVICIFLMVLVILPGSRERIAQLFKAGGSSERFALAQSALDMVRDNPFLGKGLGTFMDYFRQYAYVKGVYYAHNSYLQIAAEAGIFALVCFLLFLGSILLKSIKSFSSHHNFILLGLACAVCGFSVHAFFDNHLFSLQLAVLFWFLLGLTFSAAQLKEI